MHFNNNALETLQVHFLRFEGFDVTFLLAGNGFASKRFFFKVEKSCLVYLFRNDLKYNVSGTVDMLLMMGCSLTLIFGEMFVNE